MKIVTYQIEDTSHIFTKTWNVADCSDIEEKFSDVINWCMKQYGTYGYIINQDYTRWKVDISTSAVSEKWWGKFLFTEKQDLEWFVLKWS